MSPEDDGVEAKLAAVGVERDAGEWQVRGRQVVVVRELPGRELGKPSAAVLARTGFSTRGDSARGGVSSQHLLPTGAHQLANQCKMLELYFLTAS